MPQARGTQAKFNLYEESTYGETPGSPSGQKLYLRSFSLESTQDLTPSETLTDERERSEPSPDNIDAGGPMVGEIGAESIGTLMKHILGSATTGKSVSNQPTNVTGVEINYASTGSASGTGTLSYINASTSLTWAENGDTAGSAVDVSAGGDFTITSTSGESINVTVTAGSLPGADQNDADISVSATGYTHIFTPGDLPVGAILEKDHGANISGTGRFEYFNGARVGSVTFTFPQSGYPTMQIQCKAAGSTLAGSALDASPDDNGFTPFTSFFMGTVEEGGSQIGNIVSAQISLENGLDEDGYVLGSDSRSSLAEGFASVSGQIVTLFDSATLLNKAINNTETSLKLPLSRGTGDGSAGNEAVIFELRQMKYERRGQPIEGPAGVRQTLPFRGYKSSGGDTSLKVTVKNAVASV